MESKGRGVFEEDPQVTPYDEASFRAQWSEKTVISEFFFSFNHLLTPHPLQSLTPPPIRLFSILFLEIPCRSTMRGKKNLIFLMRYYPFFLFLFHSVSLSCTSAIFIF